MRMGMTSTATAQGTVQARGASEGFAGLLSMLTVLRDVMDALADPATVRGLVEHLRVTQEAAIEAESAANAARNDLAREQAAFNEDKANFKADYDAKAASLAAERRVAADDKADAKLAYDKGVTAEAAAKALMAAIADRDAAVSGREAGAATIAADQARLGAALKAREEKLVAGEADLARKLRAFGKAQEAIAEA